MRTFPQTVTSTHVRARLIGAHFGISGGRLPGLILKMSKSANVCLFGRSQVPDATCLSLKEIEEKLKSAQLEEKERMKLELEMNDVKRQEEEYLKKEKELEEKERLEPWNVDTIGHEAFSSSVCILYIIRFSVFVSCFSPFRAP